MSKWDRRMLGLVNMVATWSKDPSTGVGAVIVDAKNRVVSLGFNGFPRAVCDSDDALFDRDEKLRRTIHAEENALLFASRPVDGCTIYVTHPPCARCAAKMIQSGIARVVAHMPTEGFGDRWADDMRSASAMFGESGTAFECLGGVGVNEINLLRGLLVAVERVDSLTQQRVVAPTAFSEAWKDVRMLLDELRRLMEGAHAATA